MKTMPSVILVALMLGQPSLAASRDAQQSRWSCHQSLLNFRLSETLFQVSTIGALLVGGYDGAVSLRELSRHGDFGLGTFDRLDGEMVGIDGKFYQVTADGVARPVAPTMTTPFAAVTFFRADQTFELEGPMSCQELYAALDGIRPSNNFFYAIKLTGIWSYLKTRSVPPQTPPYPPLATVTATQPIFQFQDVEATLVGFWLPPSMAALNSDAYHFHALTHDRQAGGHVLDCTVSAVRVEIDETRQFQMVLPDTIKDLDLTP